MSSLGRLTVTVGLADEYSGPLDKIGYQSAKFTKQQEAIERSIDKQIRALKDQADALGFSNNEIERAKLKLRGATEEQLKYVDAIHKQKDAFYAASKAATDANAKAQAQADRSAAIDAEVRALQQYVLTQGMSTREAKLFELAQNGATDAQKRAAAAATEAIEAFARRNATQQAAAVLTERANEAARQEAEAARQASENIDKQVKALENQAAALGMSETQAKLFQLSQEGATKAQLASAEAALKQKEAFDKAQSLAGIDKQIHALKEQAEAVGKSANEIERAKFVQAGATAAQLASIDAIHKQREAYEAAGKAAEKAVAVANQKGKAGAEHSAAIDKQVRALETQRAVLGKTAGAAKLYELQQQGATKAQLEAANVALKATARYELFGKAITGLTLAFTAIGGVALLAFEAFRRIVGSLDDLDEASQGLGVSATALAEYRLAARESGIESGKFDAALTKLNLKFVDAANGGEHSAAVFKTLGISVKNTNGTLKTNEQVLGEVADKFASYRDGAEKTALAVELFGKAGARLIPLLNGGAEGLRKFAGVSQETVESARKLQIEFDNMRSGIEIAGLTIAKDLIPFVSKMIDEFNAARGAAGGLAGAMFLLGSTSGNTLEDPGKAVHELGEELGKLKQRRNEIEKSGSWNPLEFTGDLDRSIASTERRFKYLQTLQRTQALRNFSADYSNEGHRFLKTAPRVPDAKGTHDAVAAEKAALDKRLSDLDNSIKEEQRLLDTREANLQRLYANDKISIQGVYDERIAALQENTTKVAAEYQRQIDEIEKFAVGKKKAEQETATKQIGDIQEKIKANTAKNDADAAKAKEDLRKETKAYTLAVEELEVKVLELKGTEEASAEAARKRIEISQRDIRSKAAAQGEAGQRAIAAADTIAKAGENQEKLNSLQRQAATIQANLASEEAKVILAREDGFLTELEQANKLSTLRLEASAQLQRLAGDYAVVAKAIGTPEAIANMGAFSQKINEIASSAKILEKQIRATFIDTTANAFDQFLNSIAEGKSVLDSFKEAFKSFAASIIQQINRIAAAEIAASLFKKGDASGQGGGILSGIIGLIVGAIGGGAAPGSNAGGGAGYGLGPNRKHGGPVIGRQRYIVGEVGAEVFVPIGAVAQVHDKMSALLAPRKDVPAAQLSKRVKQASPIAHTPHLIGADGPELFVPKTDGIVISHHKLKQISQAIQRRATGGPVVAGEPYVVGEKGKEIFLPKTVAELFKNKKAVTDLVSAQGSKQRRAAGGDVHVATPYIVGELGPEIFVPKVPGTIIKNEAVRAIRSQAKVIEQIMPRNTLPSQIGGVAVPADFFTNTANRRAMGGSVAAMRPYIVGENGPEAFVPRAGAKITRTDGSNAEWGNHTVEQTINFYVPSNITTQTQNQIASRTLFAARRAIQRGVA